MNQEWKQEAEKRLDYLIGQGLEDRAAGWFRQGSPCCCMHWKGMVQDIFRCNEDPDIRKVVEQCEKRYGVCVYYVIVTPMFFGTSLAMFYVSRVQDEWEYEWTELRKRIPTVITYLLDSDNERESWEIGSTRVRIADGGLIREK